MVEASERSDKEPIVDDLGKQAESVKPKRAFSLARRELTEAELQSSAVHCFLLDEIDRLENETAELRDYEKRFHICDKEKAILVEKTKIPVYADIVFGLCLTIGAGLIGLLPYFSEIGQSSSGLTLGVLGVVLIIGGIIAKAVLR